MAPEGGDYSMQTVRAALETLGAQRLTKDVRDTLNTAIDDAMKAAWGKDHKARPDWPGMGSKRLRDYLQRNGPARSKLVKILDTDRMRKLGAPYMAAVRKSVTDQGQLAEEALMSGRRVTRLGEPVEALRSKDVLDPHNTYVDQLQSKGSKSVGGLVRLVPPELLFPIWWKQLKPGLNMSGKQKTFSMQNVYQRLTSQQSDRISEFLQSPEGMKLGIAGAVSAGLLSLGDAQEIFGDGSVAGPAAEFKRSQNAV
jgi:hypothetical protein